MGRKRVRLLLSQLGEATGRHRVDDGPGWGWTCNLCPDRADLWQATKEAAEELLVRHLRVHHGAHGGDLR